MSEGRKLSLRSQAWFDNSDNPDMTALYIERYLNYGLSLEELQSGKPVIGIAQSGSDLVPCNRHHLVLADRVREGIREAGGIAIEFPTHPLQETGKRPTAGLDRNLAYLALVELLYGYPLDGVVLTIGCDKTTPSALMAAATVNIPAIALSVGPMLNGWHKGERTGSGTIVWKARQMLAAGEIDYKGFVKLVASSAPSTGFCNTMGTATTMNSLAEALGMSLPGSAAIPAPYRDRQEIAYETGKRIVEMVHADRKPSDILTREAFLNAIRVNSAIGGSTNAPIHLNAIARHAGVELGLSDWETHGSDVPLMVNLQPAGEYLGEDYYRAGGVPAVMGELYRAGLLNGSVVGCDGRSVAENVGETRIEDEAVIRPFDRPLKHAAGLTVLSGNLFDGAVMKLSVISDEFRERYLSDPNDPDAFEAKVVVFDGPEDYHHRIDDPALGVDDRTVLMIRGAGPVGYPGGAEVVNMRPPAALIRAGVHALPCIGDGRQSGTSGSPSILNASPEAAVGGGLAIAQTGDRIRIDLARRRVDLLVDDAELERRQAALREADGCDYPESQTPWQEIQRALVGQFDRGAVLEPAVKYQRIAQTRGLPPRQPLMHGVRVIRRPQGDMLGEGPLWSAREQALYWVDILGRRLNRLDPVTGDIRHWDMPEPIGWVIERDKAAGFVVGMKSGIHLLTLDPLSLKRIASPEPGLPENRMNDAKADAGGRIWAGTMPMSGDRPDGALYRLDPDRTLTKMDSGYNVANGPAISPDGTWLFHTDSHLRHVYRFALAADGALGPRETFITFGDDHGAPDGMTFDAEGGLWIAHWGGARVSRFLPDGTIDRRIDLPASQITSCTFAGERLDRMYVTSAAEGVEEAEAGQLFEVDPGVRGSPTYRYAG